MIDRALYRHLYQNVSLPAPICYKDARGTNAPYFVFTKIDNKESRQTYNEAPNSHGENAFQIFGYAENPAVSDKMVEIVKDIVKGILGTVDMNYHRPTVSAMNAITDAEDGDLCIIDDGSDSCYVYSRSAKTWTAHTGDRGKSYMIWKNDTTGVSSPANGYSGISVYGSMIEMSIWWDIKV